MVKQLIGTLAVVFFLGCGEPGASPRSHRARTSTALPISLKPTFHDESSTLRVYYLHDGSKRASDFILQNVPSNVFSLPSAPSQREEVLNKGTWLIGVFGLWSIDDILAIRTAVDAAEKLGPEVNVGIRPFVDYEEIKTWCPEFVSHGSTPHWLVLVDGEFRGQAIGILDANALVEFVNRARATPLTEPVFPTPRPTAK